VLLPNIECSLVFGLVWCDDMNAVGLLSEMSHYMSLDLTAEIAVIDAGQSVDIVVDTATPWVVSLGGKLAWNNTPSCMRTQQHVLRHRPSQHTVAFSVDAVVSGDRAGVLTDQPHFTDDEERGQGLREVLSELFIRSALEGNLEVVSGLLSCQYVHVDVADSTGNTALHCASVSHHL